MVYYWINPEIKIFSHPGHDQSNKKVLKIKNKKKIIQLHNRSPVVFVF